jgi:parvulin-like peptidyl-prolyl isomerase
MRVIFKLVFAIIINVVMVSLSFATNFEKVVAIVNGVELTEADRNQESQKIAPRLAGFHRNLSSEKIKEIETQALTELVEMELQYQDAITKGIKLSEKEFNDEMQKLEKKFKSKKDFNNAIESSGFTQKKMHRLVERNLLSARMKKLEVDDKVNISEQMVKEYYNNNKEKYFKPSEFHLYQILIKVDPALSIEDKAKLKVRAESVLKKIKDGGEFAKIAETDSDDMYRIKGGDIGFVHEGRLIQEIDDAVKTLRTGDVSNIIESIYGYHIIKLVEKRETRQMPFEEVKAGINSKLVEEEKERLFSKWMDGIKRKAKIIYQ